MHPETVCVERMVGVNARRPAHPRQAVHPAMKQQGASQQEHSGCRQRGIIPMMNLTCYSSYDPAAENFSLVFDYNSDHENLCTRGDLQAPLPLCSSSALRPHSRCLVCRSGGLVYTLIRDLPRGANVMMEALGQVPIKRSDCPKALDVSDVGQNRTLEGNTPSADPLSSASVFVVVLVVLGVVCFIIYVVCKLWRRRRQRQQRDRAAAVDPTEEEALAEDAV